MQKLTLLYCFLSAVLFTVAQKQANTWYFGNRVGLNFNQLPPTPLYNSSMSSVEGSAVISDRNGRLLFYTNGLNVLNRKHGLMKNGNSLLGDLSSTDNAIFVPSPGNDSIYFLFTIGSALQLNKGLRYNVINLKGDGGFGEVTDKNVLIETESFEKLAAVRHCNNKYVWVVIHKWNTDEYHAYLVTSAGVSTTPVISHTGLFITGIQDNTIGKLKFSSNGKQLAAVHSYENNVVELMDFNNTTGVLSNPVVFRPAPPGTPQTYTGAYAAEFSPNGNLLYVTDNSSSDEPNALYQFDISSHNATTILSTRQVITRPDPYFAGALQMGPDQKIYLAMVGDTALSVIENPDVYGPGCNFIYSKIYLAQNNKTPVQFGLPNFIQSYFDPLSNPYDFTRSGKCTDRNVTFSINRLAGIDSVKWDFGDGQKSRLLSPTNNFAAPGYYTVNLIVYKIDCSGQNDTVNHTIWVTNKIDFLGPDTTSCEAISIDIGADEVEGANYLWNTGFAGNRITTSGFGLYWLEMEQNGCKVRDSINLTSKPVPMVNTGPDTSICGYQTVILRSGNTTADSYLWNTGETTSSITINRTGTYSVRVTQNSCVATDTVLVTTGDCEVFIPSAFTPNNDNRNEKFGVITDATVQLFSMQVFNKWGEMVFSSNNISDKWEGTYKGKKTPNGAYVWFLFYVNKKGERKYQQGTVMLIR